MVNRKQKIAGLIALVLALVLFVERLWSAASPSSVLGGLVIICVIYHRVFFFLKDHTE
jgi:hypothetical protein